MNIDDNSPGYNSSHLNNCIEEKVRELLTPMHRCVPNKVILP